MAHAINRRLVLRRKKRRRNDSNDTLTAIHYYYCCSCSLSPPVAISFGQWFRSLCHAVLCGVSSSSSSCFFFQKNVFVLVVDCRANDRGANPLWRRSTYGKHRLNYSDPDHVPRKLNNFSGICSIAVLCEFLPLRFLLFLQQHQSPAIVIAFSMCVDRQVCVLFFNSVFFLYFA